MYWKLQVKSEVLELGIHDLQKCGLSGKETSIVHSFVGQIESGLCHIRLMSGVNLEYSVENEVIKLEQMLAFQHEILKKYFILRAKK